MKFGSVLLSLPVALVVVVGAIALRPARGFSQTQSCSTYSCAASFQACIGNNYCGGCSPDACQCEEYASPVWYTSDCAPNTSNTACYCPLGSKDGTGGNSCDGLWQVTYNPCSGE